MSTSAFLPQLLRMPALKAGPGALKTLGSSLSALGAKKILVVTSPELKDCGVYQQLAVVLQDYGAAEVFCFDQVTPDPSMGKVEELVAMGQKAGVDVIIALGGGSPIDAAKVAAALIGNHSSVRSIIGTDLVESVLPLIAIPTTAGTGSEVTPVAILTDSQDQIKKGVVSEKLIPCLAILDPELTVNLPQKQTAWTGLDALTHAVEAFNSKKATGLTDFYAQAAIRLIMKNLRTAFHHGSNLEARAAMQLAAYYAGIAFANAGVTAAHAFAYPLGARYHLPHGLAVILMLPAVLEFNRPTQELRFTELARCLCDDPKAGAQDVVRSIVALCQDLQIHLGLNHNGVDLLALPAMAESVLTITRILDNNPRPITTLQDSTAIFERAFHYA